MNNIGLLLVIVFAVGVFVIINYMRQSGVKGVGAPAASEMLKDSSVQLLDVRTPGEFTSGHIKGAKLLPVQELSSRIGELSAWKDKTILVYCHSGNRSASACRTLTASGFGNIVNLQGGITAWKSAGFKTE